MPRSRLALVTPILAVSAVAVGATALAAPSSHHHKLSQPDTGVEVNTLPDGLRVSHVEMWVKRHGADRLVAHLAVTVRNPRPTNAHRVLAFDVCDSELCHQARARPAVVRGGQTATLRFAASIRGDAREIAGALRKPGQSRVYSDNADVALTTNAWTGRDAGRHYGLTLTDGAASRLRNVNWDISTQHVRRATMRLFVDASPDATDATLSRCDARCVMTTLQPDPDRSTTTWNIRPVISRFGARNLVLDFHDTSGASQVTANIPWPTP